jgi:hypothetical protein
MKNTIKYIFAIYCENEKKKDFIIMTTRFNYIQTRNRYLKKANNPNNDIFKQLGNETKRILLADPVFKLLCVSYLNAVRTNKLRQLLTEYFEKDINLLRNCQEFPIPPVPLPPMQENDRLCDVIGDVIEIDGQRYIQLEDGKLLTFEEAEKIYCSVQQTDQVVI